MILHLFVLSILLSLNYDIANGKPKRQLPDFGDDASTDTEYEIPNSCLNHEDDDNVMVKLLDGDSYPVINTKCRNEYMIVDLHTDALWSEYFTSTREYHYNVIGPEKDDHVNWQEWMIPHIDEFLISPDCNACDADFELNRKYMTSSAYYMTPVTDGCTQLPIGRIGCDMDWYTYACRVCETAETREPGYWTSYEIYNGLNDPATTLHFIDEVDDETFAKYGLCGFTIRDAKAGHDPKWDTFEHCKTVTHEDVEGEQIIPRRKPSMGQDGRFCVCIKPEQYETFTVSADYIAAKQLEVDEYHEEKAEIEKEEEELEGFEFSGLDDSEALNVVRLYQKHFTDGTYRITEPGKYVVMEDIVFDFKAPKGYKDGNLDTYNGPNDWWPTYDQIDDYPGAGDLKDPYFLGFWAGITIECPDVILELNHHSLQMSEAFFYQQSFFALISLTSQVFLPGQGPGFFGASPQSASNVMIRNGELGLTSHHAIQGNFNKNILIENMKIHDFKTHGIQFNGFDGITIKNVDVGPNRMVDKLTPYYAHMKALLPTYRMMVEREQVARDVCVNFQSPGRDGDCVYMADLIDDVQILLDMAFEYVILDIDWDAILNASNISSSASSSSEEEVEAENVIDTSLMDRKLALWRDNRGVLINDHHSTQTATLYGIFLNYIGSNVIGWYAGSETTKSQNVFIDNVKIHDLHHDTYENIAFSQGEATAFQRILNCLNAPFNAYQIFGNENTDAISECNNYIEPGDSKKCASWRKKPLEYFGNKITDIQILSFELINNYDLSWNYCSAGAADMAALADFAIRGTPFDELTPLLVGSHDPMIHPGKGVMGLRLNGVDNVDIKDLKITNLHSATDIGSELSGEYSNVVSQQAPYMNGFSMNMVNGLTATFSKNVVLNNVEISHVISNTGLAYGVAVWYETHMNIFGKKGLTIKHVHAGAELTPSAKFRRDSYPNLKPEGCAFRIYDDVIYNAVVRYDDNKGHEENLQISCISGHTGCLMENDDWTNIGSVDVCEDEEELQQLAVYKYKQSQSLQSSSQSIPAYIIMSIVVILSLFIIFYYKSSMCCSSKKDGKVNAENTPLLA